MPEKQNHYNQQAYEAARDIFDRYKEKTMFNPEVRYQDSDLKDTGFPIMSSS